MGKNICFFLLLLSSFFAYGRTVSLSEEYEYAKNNFDKIQNQSSYSLDLMYLNVDSTTEKTRKVTVGDDLESTDISSNLDEFFTDEQLPKDSILSYLNKNHRKNQLEFQKKVEANNKYLKQSHKEKKRILIFSKILIGLIFILVLSLIFLYTWHCAKRKEEWLRYKKLLEKLSETDELPEIGVNIQEEKETKQGKTTFLSEKTEQELLEKLNKFEKGIKYLDQQISLSSLASILHSNTKYVSYVINKYKNKSFNDYIHYLRINYIIHKMREDSRYLDYKIGFLSEECGFSSHSKFSKAFEKMTGMKPSVFMEFMQKGNI